MPNPLPRLPTEVLQKILFHLDPETVQIVQKIDSFWYSMVSLMCVRTNYWEKVCKECITEYDLYEIEKALSSTKSEFSNYWKQVYKQWHSWSNLETIEINVHKFPTPGLNGDICCSKIVDDHILFGTDLSYIWHYNINTGCYVTKYPHGTVGLLEIDAMDVETTKKLKFKSPYIFLKCVTDHVVMYQLDHERYGANRFPTIKLYEVKFFRLQHDHFVYADRYHVLRVGVIKNINDRLKLVPLYWTSLGDRTLIGLSIWKSFVTTLYRKEMEVYKFRNFNKVADTNFDDPCSKSLIHIDTNKFKPIRSTTLDVAFYKGFSVSVSYGQLCVKSFSHNVHKRLEYDYDYGVPCSVSLFGRILIIGCEQGKMFFYRVDNWAEFKLENYVRMERMDGFMDPVGKISVYEMKNKHRILVTNFHSVRFFDIEF